MYPSESVCFISRKIRAEGPKQLLTLSETTKYSTCKRVGSGGGARFALALATVGLALFNLRARPTDMQHYPKHYCGVFGILGHPNAAELTYYGLYALQHRGQESAGI